MKEPRRSPWLAHLFALPLLAAGTGARAAPFTFVTHPATGSLSVVDAATGSVVGPFTLPGTGTAIAASPDGSRVWITLSDAGSLAALDTTTGEVQSVAVGAAPAAVAVHPGGARVYVANAGEDSVAMVDAASMTVLATAAVGTQPVALAADAARLYVANFGDDSVSVLDASTLAPVATVAVGGFPAGLAIDLTAQRLWVTNHFDDTVSIIDTTLASVLTTVPVGVGPRAIAMQPGGARVYVASFGGGSVSMLDGATGATLATTASGGANPTDLVLTPSGDRLFVVHVASAVLGVLDANTLAALPATPLAAGHLAASPFVAQAPPFAQSILEVPSLSLPGLIVLAAALTALAVARLKRRRGAVLWLLLACSPPMAAVAQTFQIQDGEFAEDDWEVCVENDSGTGSHAEARATSGGNPGAYRQMDHYAESAQPLEVVHCYVATGGSYDPASAGAVATIDVSWDRRLIASDPGGAVSETFVVRQGGSTFRAAASSFTSSAWQPFSAAGLTAADFAGGPDFSAGGAPISFGYLRSTSSTGGTAFDRHGIDNFTVTVASVEETGRGVLRFASSVQAVVDGDEAQIVVLRVGGDVGAVGSQVRIPRPGGAMDAVAAVSWGDGESGERLVPSPFTGGLVEPPGIFESRMTLEPPTGGATLHPSAAKAILLVGSPEAGPALAFLAAARTLFAGVDPWWLAGAGALALYAARLRRRPASHPAATPPAPPPR